MTAALDPSRSGPARATPSAGLRVLWLTTRACPDGPGRALLALLKHWRPEDAIAVCALGEVSDEFRAELPANVETYALGMTHPMDVTVVPRLARLCRTWRPDVLHTQLSRADWIGRAVGRTVGVPVVSTIQNVHSRMYRAEFSWLPANLGLALDRATSPLAARLIAVSQGVADDLMAHGVSGDRIAVIPNSLSADRRAPRGTRDAIRQAWGVAADDVVVGTVALLKPQKGIPYLIEAARIAVAANPRVRFVHMGSGPLAADIERRVARAGLNGRFLLMSHVGDPVTLLPGLDLFALSSLWEGLPVAMLEAMAADLPLVGTRVPGIVDVIDHGRNGLLVPPADAGALAGAVLELAGDANLRARFAHASGRRLQRFEASAVAGSYRDLFAGVIAGRDSARAAMDQNGEARAGLLAEQDVAHSAPSQRRAV